MKQVATLFDALQNEKFAVAVKDASGFVKYYGFDGQGREWAMWANSVDEKSLQSSHLPAGIIQGPFKGVNENDLKSLLVSLGSPETEKIVESISNSTIYKFKSSYRQPNGSVVPAVMDTPINYFTKSQYEQTIAYKGLTFRSLVKEGSFLLEARVNDYAFNFETSMFSCKPSVAETKSLRQRIDSNLGRSSERRIGMKFKNHILEKGQRMQVGASYALETKSLELDMETKIMGNLGQRIGSGARLARRTARGVFARFDPYAWDGDGDGIVQEGTPFERPAIPGVNDKLTRGNVDPKKATEAWLDSGGSKLSTVMGRGEPAALRPRKMPQIPRSGRVGAYKRSERRLGRRLTTEESMNLLSPRERTRQGRLQEEAFRVPEETDVPSSRAEARATSGLRSRVSTARMDRQASGLASRSAKAKKKSKIKGRPGIDRVDASDGDIWESLTPEQEDVVSRNAEEAYKKLMERIKADNDDWWSSFLAQNTGTKNRTKRDADGNEWSQDSRIDGEAFTSFELWVEDSMNDALYAVISETDPKKKEAAQRRLDRALRMMDDLKTLNEMWNANDGKHDWSLLEHLHPETRSRLLGVRRAGWRKDEKYEPVAADNPKAKKLIGQLADKQSTYFEEVGGVKRGKSIIGEAGDRKLAELARKITRPNPERAERRRLRKAGRGIAVEDIEKASDKSSPLKRRIRRAKNELKMKIKGKRDASKIDSTVNSSIGKNPHAFRRPDGSIVVDDEVISILARMADGFKVRKKRKGEAVVTNQNARKVLVSLWNGNNYNATPTWIREDEIPALIEQGWIPVQRGFKKEAYADIWLNSPKRHVTGEGAAVVGAGEYWAHPDSTSWDSYLKENELAGVQKNGAVFAMVRRDRIVSKSQAEKLRNDHQQAVVAMNAYLDGEGSGGRWDTELTTQELVREIRARMEKTFPSDSDFWKTESGQLFEGVFKWMESVDPGDSRAQKNAVNAIKFLRSIADSDTTVVAGFYGYDGVDFGLGDGRVVLHNRSAMVAVNRPMDLNEVKQINRKSKEAAGK